jgi:hypothetical protein
MNTNLPWSAEGEARLRRRIHLLWTIGRLFFLTGVVSLFAAIIVHWLLALAAAFIGLAMFCAGRGRELLDELGWEAGMTRVGFVAGSGMLANKPRSTANLTQWTQHFVSVNCDASCCSGFNCSYCERRHLWTDAKWIPNFSADTMQLADGEDIAQIDPGGGRFVILCKCGRGHYKLKGELDR